MKKLYTAVWTEFLKVRSSKVFLGTVIYFIVMPVMATFYSAGVVSNAMKDMASVNENNWQSFWVMLKQISMAGSAFGFGFIAAWIFGREYVNNTMKDLLALPIPRETMAAAKLIIMFLWSAFLALCMFITFLCGGLVLGLDGWSWHFMWQMLALHLIISLMVFSLAAPIAFIANWTRGYLAGLVFLFIVIIIANFISSFEFSKYYPWNIPGIYMYKGAMEPMSLVILISIGIAGFAGTVAWWRFADQK
jgi:ABC-2 type transport system permease protein